MAKIIGMLPLLLACCFASNYSIPVHDDHEDYLLGAKRIDRQQVYELQSPRVRMVACAEYDFATVSLNEVVLWTTPTIAGCGQKYSKRATITKEHGGIQDFLYHEGQLFVAEEGALRVFDPASDKLELIGYQEFTDDYYLFKLADVVYCCLADGTLYRYESRRFISDGVLPLDVFSLGAAVASIKVDQLRVCITLKDRKEFLILEKTETGWEYSIVFEGYTEIDVPAPGYLCCMSIDQTLQLKEYDQKNHCYRTIADCSLSQTCSLSHSFMFCINGYRYVGCLLSDGSIRIFLLDPPCKRLWSVLVRQFDYGTGMLCWGDDFVYRDEDGAILLSRFSLNSELKKNSDLYYCAALM